jgi:chitodextrinase
MKKVFLLLLVLSVLQSSIYLPFGAGRVYGLDQEAAETRDAAATPHSSGRALMGYPGLESIPATPEDIAVLNSAGDDTVMARILPSVNSSRTFYARDFSVAPTIAYYQVAADLKRIGAHSYIYLQQGVTTVTDAMLDSIVTEFETIYAKDTDSFGSEPDVDKDKRINILLMDINDSSGGGYIAGYFSAINELPAVNYPGLSNQCEIFYMDVNQGLPDNAGKVNDFFGTLAHEFQHMIQYGVYLSHFSLSNDMEELWMNEAFSQLAIFLNGYGHPVYDVESFMADQEGANQGLLDFNNDLAEYGESYLFALYLYDRFGAGFIKNLTQNPLTGVAGINDQLVRDGKNTTFEEIFEKFQIAMAVDNSSDFGEYSFSSIDLSSIRDNPRYFSKSTILFKSLSSLSNQYTTQVTTLPSTRGGSYRGYGALIDGTRTTGAVNLKLENATGSYYIIKPEGSTAAATYSAFAPISKTIEKLNPDIVNGNTVKLNNDQIALLLYIAKGTPIANKIMITEVAVPADDVKPSTPTIITHTTSYNAISLSWQPSSYTKGIKGYNIYRGSTKINTNAIITTSYTDFTVSSSNTYTYTVEAIGMDDAVSSRSDPATVSTPATPDIVPPAAPSLVYISTRQTTSTLAGITFRLTDTVNAASEISRYEIAILQDGMTNTVFSGDSSDLNVNSEITGFRFNQVYNLYAYAVDTAGNYSQKSPVLRINAGIGPAALNFPTKPANLTGSAIGNHSITISWDASTAAAGILHYNIFRNGVFLTTTSSISYTDSSLDANTTYRYAVEAVGNDADRLNSELSDTLSIIIDRTPPANIAGYPAKGSETDSTVPVQSKLNENGKTYFVCLAAGEAAPSSIQVKQGQNSSGSAVAANRKGSFAVSANTVGGTTIKGLRGMTGYDVYIVSEDAAGNLQTAPVKVGVMTLQDTTPPAFAAAYPKQASVTANSVTIAVKTNEYGKAYYVLLDDNAASPSALQVRTGLNASGAAVSLKGSTDLTGDAESSFSVSGLSSSTSYDVYIVAEDVSDQLQATPVKVDVTTSPTSSDPGPGQVTIPGGTGPSPVIPVAAPVSPAAINSSPTDIIPVQPVLSGAGKATAAVGSDDIDKAFEQAGQSAGGKKITIDIEELPGASQYTVMLPANQVSSGRVDKKIEIQTAIGSIEIPSNMFQGSDVGSAPVIGISIGTADKSKLGSDILKNIGTRPVIELGVSVDGKPFSWQSDNAAVTVTVDYVPSAEELKDPEHIVVWYIDGNGKAVSVPTGRYDPVTKKVTFTTDHFSTYAVVYFQKTFKDIAGSWAKKEIEVMASKGIINGTSDTTFSPDAQITRADFISLLVRTLGLKAKFSTTFSDVKKTDPYYEAVGIAKKLGITNGTGNNKFNPKESISRQDMAALTLKAMQVAGKIDKKAIAKQTLKYNDAPSIASYAYESIVILIERKIIEKKGLEFKPKEFITRAEMADVIYNIYTN